MDIITAIGAKRKGYDGVIFTDGNFFNQAIDLRNHNLNDLEREYKKILLGEYD